MELFIVLLCVPMMIQHIAIKGHHVDYQKRNRLAMAFFFCLLTAMVMLRHRGVGNDTENYIYYFRRFSRMDWSRLRSVGMERGFVYFNKLVSLVSTEPQVYLAVSAAITMIPIYFTYKRLCTDSSLTIVLFCILSTFTMLFSGIRQMLAVSIGFLAYEYIRKRKLVPFIVAVLLAMSMHTSAFILGFMYPLYHARITKKWLYVVVPLLAVIFVFNNQVFSVLAAILMQFTEFDNTMTTTGAYTMLILFAAFTGFSYLIPDESSMDEETIGLRNFLLFSLVVQMFAPLHSLAMRMNYYYIIFIPLLIPKVVQCKSKRWNQVAVFGRQAMVVFFLFYFLYTARSGGGLNVFPYHFFWEKLG